MDDRISTCADKIINICNELKVLLSNDGTFNAYKQKLLGKLQRASLKLGEIDFREDDAEGITAEDKARGFYFRTINGNTIAFDVDTENPVGGQLRAVGGREQNESEENKTPTTLQEMFEQVRKEREGRKKRVDYSSDNWAITHFEKDGRNVHFEVPLAVGMFENDDKPDYVMHKGDVKNCIVFASNDYGDKVKIKDYLARTVGGSPDSWKHMVGDATVSSFDGKKWKAQVHYFESDEVGQTGWKVKKIYGGA